MPLCLAAWTSSHHVTSTWFKHAQKKNTTETIRKTQLLFSDPIMKRFNGVRNLSDRGWSDQLTCSHFYSDGTFDRSEELHVNATIVESRRGNDHVLQKLCMLSQWWTQLGPLFRTLPVFKGQRGFPTSSSTITCRRVSGMYVSFLHTTGDSRYAEIPGCCSRNPPSISKP